MFNNKVTSLKKKSSEILNVFSKTLVDLSRVNDEIAAESDRKFAELTQIREDMDELQNQRLSNAKVISKIQEFLA